MKEAEKSMCNSTDKIYAVLIAKHANGGKTIHFVTAPHSISDTVNRVANQYPDCKIRIFEHGRQQEYFYGIIDRMW